MVNNHYQAFFVQSTVGMGCLDLSESILEVNPAFCQLLGYSATELVGLRFPHLVHPVDLAIHQDCLQSLLTEQVPSLRLEQRLLCRSGKSHWVLSRFSLLKYAETGAQVCIAGTFEDIDHRKRLETDLRHRADRDSLLAEFTQQILKSLDLKQVLQLSVDSVRRYLQADRAIVYRHETDCAEPKYSQFPQLRVGTVIVESVGSEWRSMLHHRIQDSCLHLNTCLQPFRAGQVSAIANIEETGYSPCYVDLLKSYQVVGNLVVPILQDVNVWGLLSVQQCRGARVWEADEIGLVKQIAAQLAIALNQIALQSQLQQEAQNQQAINELSQAILSIQNLETFFELALTKILEVFQADHVAIGQYRPDSNRWLLIAEEKREDTLTSLLGEELVFAPNRLWPGETDLTPLIMAASDLAAPEDSQSIATIFAEPWILSPLVINSGLWGSLIVYKAHPAPSQWAASNLDLIQLISQQLSLAIQQNRLYRQWQRQAEQQTALHRVINAIRESLDLSEIFERTAAEVRGLLQIERVLIFEFDPNQRLWVVRIDERTGDEANPFVGLEIPDDNNALAHRLKQGEILRFNAHEPFQEEALQILAKTFPGAWLLVPLQVSQMTWGALHCIQKDNWQAWQQDIAIAVADKLAIAIQQSMLYQQVQAANYRLQELVIIDSLTQIPNRRYFDETLQQEWQRAQRDQKALSLILCDVDYFKHYNDTYGHQLGDEALKAIAHVLKRSVQRSGDVVARYGGEEFAIILPSTTSVGATRIAEAIQTAVNQQAIPHSTSTTSQIVTLSLGIASIYPQPDYAPTQLLLLADQALYRAKREGRNRFCIHTHAH